MICGSGGWKSRLAKAVGAEPSGQMRNEKLHAAVARSAFPSQHVQNTPASDHFWKFGCRKSAPHFRATFGGIDVEKRKCGAKHVSKSKCAKRIIFAPFLEDQMPQKC